MVTLYPTIDTHIHQYSGNAGTNYNTANPLEIHGNMPYRIYGFMEFDLTGIGAITSCILKFYSENAVFGTSDYIHVKRCTTQQNLSTITWNNNVTVTTDTNYGSQHATYPANKWYNIDITNLVNDETTNKLLIKLIYLRPGGDTNGWMDITPENASLNRPYLNILYSTPTDYYVKTTGDDYKNGQSWANAWKTINQAATQTPDGATLHIGHGNYNAEPAYNIIQPTNAGSLGIKYKPVTADTGAEVAGTVIIEKN